MFGTKRGGLLTIKLSESDLWPGKESPAQVIEELKSIRAEMIADASQSAPRLDQVHANYRDSARNLLHYLALRRRDLRPLQLRLAALGLSSLGRAESHVLATVDAVLEILYRLTGSPRQAIAPEAAPIDFETGERLLADHTEAMFGPAKPARRVRIMVTMPSEAADDYTLVHELLQRGMDGMRINCAHDDAVAWARMIEHLRRAEQELGRSCRVFMDLSGPKLRTGPLEPGPAVIRVRPRRDVFGRVKTPARIWLTAGTAPRPAPSRADACLPVPEMWLARLRPGDKVKFTDTRDSKRTLVVSDVMAGGCWAEASKTVYIDPGIVLRHEREGDDREGVIGAIPPTENAIDLQEGDQLILTRNLEPGRPATRNGAGQVLTPAVIGCTIPEVFDTVQFGESICFDDGKICGMIEKVETERVLIRITRTRLGGEKLRADKGINLPESNLRLPALGAKDLEDLTFVAKHADVVELSFANCSEDVESLQKNLKRLTSRSPAIVLKIETRRGFDNLPDMLLTAMRSPCCGVMIARGDLAVECGFQRLAEVQEEILWICEAAHVPVIWATQVLEMLAKEGMPTMAEITDAAMGDRAECVMLNKGPHVLNAVLVLDDVLRRMQDHQSKKSAMLRELRLARARRAEPGDAADGGA
ncbi:pyruvate kinase [Rhodohalobacter barkolensis]|uniref:pyruvate kinase n=1 Tax=Rhodohalobacter barkolensis TaxID=2053187 RepID=A0A2N0VJ71_9BACT|nr:pyruvate kinase [Rhodohalobacter barkolensis]